ncbi:MAG: hypothetical protein IJ816_01250 [Alloprevotella sp.]|nr:hypothetical protein [Alloprevotella sp.]
MKKTSLLVILLFCLSAQIGLAENICTSNVCEGMQREHPQRNPKKSHFDPTEFKARFDAYITQRLGLNKQETSELLLAYHQMRQAQRNNDSFVRRMLKKQQGTESDEKEANKVLNEIIKMREKNANIENDFYKKAIKKIGAKKLLQFQLAEKNFFMHEWKKFAK